jgi:hypothetical protein
MPKGLQLELLSHYLGCTQKYAAKLVLGACFCVFIVLGAPTVVNGASISEKFPSQESYPSGTLVSIGKDDPDEISLADLGTPDFLLGVVEDENSSLLSITREVGDVTVALSGEAQVFVSDINGEIKTGDFIGSSWISGVGMKSLQSQEQKLIGIALEDFGEDSTNFIEVEDIDTANGKKTAKISKIVIRLFDRQIGADFGTASDDTTALERFAARVAGKQVLFARVIAAAVLFLVSSVISAVFLANAIRGSFISLGRNPLASGSIYSNLVQVSGVSIGVVLVGSVLAYVVLVI